MISLDVIIETKLDMGMAVRGELTEEVSIVIIGARSLRDVFTGGVESERLGLSPVNPILKADGPA